MAHNHVCFRNMMNHFKFWFAINFQVNPRSVAPSQPGYRLTKSGHPWTGRPGFCSAEEIRPRRPQPRSFDGSTQQQSRLSRRRTFCRILERRRRQCHPLTSFAKRVQSFVTRYSNCRHNSNSNRILQQGSFFTNLLDGKLERFILTIMHSLQ